jgi:conjugal transfer/type IV secretion protein DotA/TraY
MVHQHCCHLRGGGGAIILEWSFLMGIVGTAYEGRILGQQIIWGPIESGIAVVLMAPLAKGLCALQILILLLISGSINFANVIWKSGLDFMAYKINRQMVMKIPEKIKGNTEKIADGTL